MMKDNQYGISTSILPQQGKKQRRPLASVCTAVMAVALFATIAQADVINLQITLDSWQEVPIVDTTGTGTGTATLDTATLEFTWNISFSNLEGTPTAANFYAPAPVCQSGGIVLDLPFQSPIIGSTTISQQEADQILAGFWYVNILTDLHPTGEIRGQIEPEPIPDPFPTVIPVGDIAVRLTPVATGLTAPNWGAAAPGIAGHLFVTDQNGILWNINLADGTKSTFLDVQNRLVTLGVFGPDTFDERGLLGLAFHPDYQNNGLLYTYTSEPFTGTPADFSTMPIGVDPDHQSIIAEWQVLDPTDPNTTVDLNSLRILLRIDEPQFNHDAGGVNFGPDGLLYVTLGDGGNGDDEDAPLDFLGLPAFGHGCDGNGRNLDTILGSLIRINPQGNNSANGQYGIPASNPFVGQGVVEEIYAYGLRNPFRFSFDKANGDLYLADVGQNHVEEINIVSAGDNLGWNVMEGSFRFVRNALQPGYAADPSNIDTTGLTMPIAEYDHDEGLAILGGFVYRGNGVSALKGRYVFGDFARTFLNDGRVFYLDATNAIQEFDLLDGPLNRSVLGFGQDGDGEVYVMANSTGTPFDTTGEVLRIDPPLDLVLTGSCPGLIIATVTNATPGNSVAFVRASGVGEQGVPNGMPCAGTTLGLNQTAQLVAVVKADMNGVASVQGMVPGSLCGKVVLQAIELENSANCATSRVVAVE